MSTAATETILILGNPLFKMKLITQLKDVGQQQQLKQCGISLFVLHSITSDYLGLNIKTKNHFVINPDNKKQYWYRKADNTCTCTKAKHNIPIKILQYMYRAKRNSQTKILIHKQ